MNQKAYTLTVANSSARWRDEPIIPDIYDPAILIPLAREARNRLVEFDWPFNQEDLMDVRRSVFEWGCEVRGRYKCFASRTLTAINAAIGETNSAFVLSEPKNGQGTQCQVNCVATEGVFRLRGYATFDIVFGYSVAGLGQHPWSSYLGPTARNTIINGFNKLGWDLPRLQTNEFIRVRNTLYNFPVNYGTQPLPPSKSAGKTIEVHFQGPFSAHDNLDHPCLFTNKLAECKGVYLWTLEVNGMPQVWYVGQTRRNFGQRIAEHLEAYLSGRNKVYDIEELAKGVYRLPIEASEGGAWPNTMPFFLKNHRIIAENVTALIKLSKFHLAPLDNPDPGLDAYNQVEGLIGRYFKAHPNPDLREFFLPGLKFPAVPYGHAPRLKLSAQTPIAGFPSEL
jgi:hypothetical protein